eukprot:scaffold98385_cov30-Tisochrysis_lutea.AAC.1
MMVRMLLLGRACQLQRMYSAYDLAPPLNLQGRSMDIPCSLCVSVPSRGKQDGGSVLSRCIPPSICLITTRLVFYVRPGPTVQLSTIVKTIGAPSARLPLLTGLQPVSVPPKASPPPRLPPACLPPHCPQTLWVLPIRHHLNSSYQLACSHSHTHKI